VQCTIIFFGEWFTSTHGICASPSTKTHVVYVWWRTSSYSPYYEATPEPDLFMHDGAQLHVLRIVRQPLNKICSCMMGHNFMFSALWGSPSTRFVHAWWGTTSCSPHCEAAPEQGLLMHDRAPPHVLCIVRQPLDQICSCMMGHNFMFSALWGSPWTRLVHAWWDTTSCSPHCEAASQWPVSRARRSSQLACTISWP
jgi:hypothetical protein